MNNFIILLARRAGPPLAYDSMISAAGQAAATSQPTVPAARSRIQPKWPMPSGPPSQKEKGPPDSQA